MLGISKIKGSVLTVGVALALSCNVANAVVTYAVDSSTTNNIPGLTGFATNGSQMSGMLVSAAFSGGLSQSLSWATTGATSGGVSGSGWGLSLDSDSFGGSWNFSLSPNSALGTLTRLVLNGAPGFTVFDRTNPSWGTDGSAQGMVYASTRAPNCKPLWSTRSLHGDVSS